MKSMNRLFTVSLAALCISLASCQTESLYIGDSTLDRPVTVTLGVPSTRAGEDVPDIADERRIMVADVFAYNRSTGRLVNSAHETFGAGLETGVSVAMELSKNPVDIYAVVNFPGDIQEAGKTLSGLREAVSSYTDNALGFFTMTGKSLNFNPAVSTSASIVLKRIADKVVVKRITSDFPESSPLHGKKVTLKDIRLVNVRRQVSLFPDNDIDPRPAASDASFINPRSFTDMYMSLYGRPHFGEISDGGYSLDESLYFYPNSSAEASSVAGDDYVTKIVFTFDIGGTVYRYPVGLPQAAGSAGRNLVYEISNLRLYMSGNPESDSPNKYISGTTLSMTLNVLDWDTYEDWRGMTHDPAVEPVFTVENLSFPGLAGTSTVTVSSGSRTLTGRFTAEAWQALYSSDGGDTWTNVFPSWLSVSPASGSGGEAQNVTLTWDKSLPAVATLNGSRVRFAQVSAASFVDKAVNNLRFAGTATGPFTVRIVTDGDAVTDPTDWKNPSNQYYNESADHPYYKGAEVSSVTVTPVSGSFDVELPALSDGQRYSFASQTELTSVTALPDILRAGHGAYDAMFQFCSNLTSVCGFDTGSAIRAVKMFQGCVRLTSAPLSWANLEDGSYLYDGCAFTSVSGASMPSCRLYESMFKNCDKLVTVSFSENYSGPDGTFFGAAFQSCSKLTTVTGIDWTGNTSTAWMFQGCSSMVTAPVIDMSSTLHMEGMFGNCTRLTTIPAYNVSASCNADGEGAYWGNTFAGCSALTTVGGFNGLSCDMAFLDCRNLTDQSIKNIFNGLGIVSGKKLWFKKNTTTATNVNANKTIATDKGWTVSVN